jgi:predicted PurR-regulated permease PerM
MKNKIFNTNITQVVVLIIIILIAILLFKQLFAFLPGILGAITLYIVSRSSFFNLIYKKKWPKSLTALLYILVCLVVITALVFISVSLIRPKVNEVFKNQEKIISILEYTTKSIEEKIGTSLLSSENIKSLAQKVTSGLPSFISGTASAIVNLFMMFFLFYFLLVGGRDVEKKLQKLIPLKPTNINILASETKLMIKANALGIPLICLVQGIFAALGYLIFGVDDWAMWGFLTGVFAFFPLVGTMIIWVPLCIFLYSQGFNYSALGLLLYSLLVTGNVDYVARISIMKKMGDVHPLITILGVIVGLNIFGFIGLIFGPLLISYFLILVKIYINEFSTGNQEELTT